MHVVRVTENAYKDAYRAKAAGAEPSAVRLMTVSLLVANLACLGV